MGCAHRRVRPKVNSHVNRNFESLLQRYLVSVVSELPPPWQSKNHGHMLYADCCTGKDLRFHRDLPQGQGPPEETLFHTDGLPDHSVIHRGMTDMLLLNVRRVLSKTVLRLRRDGITIVVDASGMSTTDRSL